MRIKILILLLFAAFGAQGQTIIKLAGNTRDTVLAKGFIRADTGIRCLGLINLNGDDYKLTTDATGKLILRPDLGGSASTDDQQLTISNDTIFLEDGGYVVLPASGVTYDTTYLYNFIDSLYNDAISQDDTGTTQTLNLTYPQLSISGGNTVTFPDTITAAQKATWDTAYARRITNIQITGTTTKTVTVTLGSGQTVSGTFTDLQGVLSETDPLWSASPSFGITNTNISNWNTSYNHKINSGSYFNDTLRLYRQNGDSVLIYLPTSGAGLGTVTSVGLTVPSWLSVANSPITGAGTLVVTATSGQAANKFLATPDGVTGAVGLRSIVADDIPPLNYQPPGNYVDSTQLADSMQVVRDSLFEIRNDIPDVSGFGTGNLDSVSSTDGSLLPGPVIGGVQDMAINTGHSNAFTVQQIFRRNGLATTSAPAISSGNGTNPTAAVPVQVAPYMENYGRAFDSSDNSTEYHGFAWHTVPISGQATSAHFALGYGTNTTAALSYTDFLYVHSNGSISANTSFNELSAILNLYDTARGFLAPRMTTTQKGNISSPATGLLVYDTDLAKFSYYDGSTWKIICTDCAGGGGGTDDWNNFTNVPQPIQDIEGITYNANDFLMHDGTNIVDQTPNQVKVTLGLNNVDNTSDATKNAASVALTNKTIDGDLNTLQDIPQSAVTNLTTDLAGKQPLDADLTAVAGLTPTNDDVLQRKAGAWTNRSIAQLITDLIAGGVVTATSTTTMTNKTLTSPVISSIVNTGTQTVPTVTGTLVQYVEGTTASSATPTPTGDARNNFYDITALATNPTFAAPSGTPANHNSILIRIKDNGTTRTLAWNAIYRAGTDFALPTATVVNKTLYVQFVYNSADSKWDCVGKSDGF